MLLGDFQFAKSPLNRLVFNGLSMLDTSIKTRPNFKFFLTLTRGIPYPMCSEAKHWVGMDSGPSVSSAFLAPGYIV